MRSGMAVRALAVLGAVGAPACLAGEPAAAPVSLDFEVEGDFIRHPIWGVQIQVPGYAAWDELADLRPRPNFVLAASSDQTCHLPVTMWVERIPDGTTPEQCRRGFMGNPEPIRKSRDAWLFEEQTAPVTYTLFDMFLQKGNPSGPVQNQLYGYWVRSGHCFELHVSSMDCSGFAAQAMPILQSVKISEDTGATIETVALAKRTGGDPRSWHMHLAMAGLIFYGKGLGDPKAPESGKLNDPGRARRFYESALRLGGDDIPPSDLWLIEEGIGISWLRQEDGQHALSHLERALVTARMPADARIPVWETLYNLACAHTLAGDLEAACGRLREMFSGLGPERWASEMKTIRDDRQLKPLRKADCFKALASEFGGR